MIINYLLQNIMMLGKQYKGITMSENEKDAISKIKRLIDNEIEGMVWKKVY